MKKIILAVVLSLLSANSGSKKDLNKKFIEQRNKRK